MKFDNLSILKKLFAMITSFLSFNGAKIINIPAKIWQ